MISLYINKVNIDYHIVVFTADYIEYIGFFCCHGFLLLPLFLMHPALYCIYSHPLTIFTGINGFQYNYIISLHPSVMPLQGGLIYVLKSRFATHCSVSKYIGNNQISMSKKKKNLLSTKYQRERYSTIRWQWWVCLFL